MNTKEALERAEVWYRHYDLEKLVGQLGGYAKQDAEALAVLKMAVKERDALKERLKNTEGWWRNAQTYGMRMERSRNALKGPLAQMKARALKAEADLERARPLLRKIERGRDDGENFYFRDDGTSFTKKAIAYRAAKEAKEKK